jgi:hypothetical protein
VPSPSHSSPVRVAAAGQTIRYSPTISEVAYREIVELLRTAADERVAQRRLLGFAGHAGSRPERERAAVLVLCDLMRQGWRVSTEEGGIWVSAIGGSAHGGERAEEAKRRVRETLQVFRGVQLGEPAIERFLQGMERPRVVGGRRVSILDLVDDGHDLSVTLADIARLPPSLRDQALAQVVRPTLQVATPDDRCEHTGLPLFDVWRYFRHTWSLEYRTTPGRSLAFLVRNAARPMAPVMGIASIANAALQLRVRDNWIGWSTKKVLETIEHDHEQWPALRRAMVKTVASALENLRIDDLMAEAGDVEGAELETRLRALAGAAREARTRRLQERSSRSARGDSVESLHLLPTKPDGKTDWVKASEGALFKRKRAETLANLLFAARVLEHLPTRGQKIVAALEGKEAQRAITIAAREIRKVGLSSRLLDVNVCGAVPPYRELLVGKLVALAMASDEVAVAYRRRYFGQVSEIASQMAGAPIKRQSEVSILTTTSLYGAVSSQYNRLKISAKTVDGAPVAIRWRDLGNTEGWGTTHFAEGTVESLREVARDKVEHRNVNNVFGEGQSPRLRQVREGLAALGLDVEVYLKHSHPRRVYGLELGADARQALLLNQTAKFKRASFDEIAAAWRQRWFSGRVADDRVRDQISRQGPASVKAELTAATSTQQLPLFAPKPPVRITPTLQWSGVMPTHSDPTLIQSLYRALGACADHHSDDVVKRLHIETPVDAFIKAKAARRVLFITGNPGDGKTHLLKRLAKPLTAAKVEVCLDANELPNEALIARINKAVRSRTKGLALAINEGILVQLLSHDDAKDEPWVEPVKRQLLSPMAYRADDHELEDDRFLVVDLNLRNNLSSKIVAAALQRQLSYAAPCDGCPGARGCSLYVNAQRLADNGRSVERVTALLDALAAIGVHATMRELQGLIAVMLTDRQTCAEAKANGAASPYWINVFEGGEGPLFEALRRFDPATITHPLLDDKLWRRADRDDDWFAPWPRQATTTAPLDDRLEELQNTKRRALFEHADGAALLSSSDQVDEELAELLQADTRALRRIVRWLNRFFDRDEETSEHLYLWMTHRYDANASRYAAASAAVPLADLELLLPRLRAPLDQAFPDFRADHAILTTKRANGQVGLRIDRLLVEALLAAERGLPTTFRRGEPEARVSGFISKLAKIYRDAAKQDQIQVRLVDRDTGRNVEVTVDVAGRSFPRS